MEENPHGAVKLNIVYDRSLCTEPTLYDGISLFPPVRPSICNTLIFLLFFGKVGKQDPVGNELWYL